MSESTTNSDLKNEIKVLSTELLELARDNMKSAMKSHAPLVYFYNSLAESYEKAFNICNQYFEDFNISHFVEEMIKHGYGFEILHLKKYVVDPNVLAKFSVFEKYFNSEEEE